MENKNLFSKLTNILKAIIIIAAIVLQIGLFIFTTNKLNELAFNTNKIISIIGLLMILFILYKDTKSSYKISWIIIIALSPVTGILLYLIFGEKKFSKRIYKKIKKVEILNEHFFVQNKEVLNEISDEGFKRQAELIYNLSKYPVYKNTNVKYLSIGEIFHEKLLKELKSAKKFIFMEYFIVSDGKMHRSIMEILKEKANSGVDVRYMYDVAGSISTLPKGFIDECKENNIKILPFNKVSHRLYTFLSYRDHRKITVIDGNKGFTGGINIGDEYINEYKKYGHWKDMAMYLEGDGVYSLTSMFLWLWNISTNENTHFQDYKPTIKVENDTFVVPFTDGPIDNVNIGENNYIRIINNAKKYVYITTPYLIIDENFLTSLKLAASSGVDVRIITPHIPDKKIVFEVTRSYYAELVKSGVKIFEYTPGFVHGKIMVADGNTSVVGTINLDYRSLSWNFECSCLVFDKTFAQDITKDYLETIKQCQEVDSHLWENTTIIKKIKQSLLKLIGPLL
ncbi:MAG: cardiolipin synthase [Bacilli bacterium]